MIHASLVRWVSNLKSSQLIFTKEERYDQMIVSWKQSHLTLMIKSSFNNTFNIFILTLILKTMFMLLLLRSILYHIHLMSWSSSGHTINHIHIHPHYHHHKSYFHTLVMTTIDNYIVTLISLISNGKTNWNEYPPHSNWSPSFECPLSTQFKPTMSEIFPSP